MRILAVDTSGDACSCALWHDGAVCQRLLVAPRRHAELVLVMADEVLAEAGCGRGDLDVVAFGRGPGSFTGLRIAAGVTQGIAYARDLPVAPVSSLAALAQGALRGGGWRRVLAAFDARMEEIYWAAYAADERGLMQTVIAEAVTRPAAALLPEDAGWHGAGQGWAAHGGLLAARLGEQLVGMAPDRHPEARDVATLAAPMAQAGLTVGAEAAVPVYLRNRVATPPA